MAVQNLLSFAEQELEFDPGLTVIVGPNGAGKSNLVRLLGLAGIGLEWLEDRSSGMSRPGQARQAQAALAAYAAGRHQGAADDAYLRLEVGVELDQDEMSDLACFVRAAIVSSVLSRQHSGHEAIAAWAEEQITPDSLAALSAGSLVMAHQGSPDAPWAVSYEFTHDDSRFAWELAGRGGGQVIRPLAGQAVSPPGGAYEPVWNALTGSAASTPGASDPPRLPPFSLGLLCRKAGAPVEAPLVQPPGAAFSPDLPPHRRFAELAGIPAWTLPANRTYSLGWVLRLVFRRGLRVLGEQFRGVATMSAPLREVGRFGIGELSEPAPGFEPYALPLRLLRLKNGDLEQRERFRQFQELFSRLAPGREADLSFTVQPRAGEGEADTPEPEAAITVLIRHRDPLTRSDWELPVQLCGAGTWEALVVAEAITDSDGRAVVLDEPAANLHPGWQQLLRAQIRARSGSGQFVLITHSPYLVPMEDESDLYHLVRAAPRDGATRFARVRQPIGEAHTVMRDYSMSADARALLFASGAVLLEGDTELGALPLWFARSPAAREVGDPEGLHLRFYSVGGDTHFRAPLTLVAALGIPWVIICGGWLFDPRFRGNHIFRQVAAAGAGTPALQSFTGTYIDTPANAGAVTFEQATAEGARNGIFTLARGWTRDDRKNSVPGDESFEHFIEAIMPGELARAEAEAGRSKSLRKGRWLAENHPCPSQIDDLYRGIVTALKAAGMPAGIPNRMP